MVAIEVIFLLLSASVSLSKATITNKPFENTEHNNLFFDEDILFERTARSTSDCAHHCGKRSTCLSFTFAKNWASSAERSGTCRGNSALKVSGTTSSRAGAKTFIMADMCMNAPCQNGGTCVNRVDQPYGYLCQCTPGYTDLQCQTDIDQCSSSPCQNGGTCVDQVNGYLCQCVPGYGDVHCLTDINECASSPCQHGGTCVNGVNSYTCTCEDGFSGTNCESVDWLGRSCTSNANCPSALRTVCLYGQCLCLPENYYSAASGGCVATCATADLKWTFLEYSNLEFQEVYYMDQSDQGLAPCQSFCQTNDQCHGFNFSPEPAGWYPCWRVKQFSAGTYYTIGGSWTLYKKTCA